MFPNDNMTNCSNNDKKLKDTFSFSFRVSPILSLKVLVKITKKEVSGETKNFVPYLPNEFEVVLFNSQKLARRLCYYRAIPRQIVQDRFPESRSHTKSADCHGIL